MTAREAAPGQAATLLLCDNKPVMDALMRALADPAKFLNRAPLESMTSWQRRAIVEHVAPLIIDAFEESDHRQPLSVAVRALRTIAWGTTPDGHPIDPSVVADKALTEMRLADEEATADYGAVTAAAAAQGAPGDVHVDWHMTTGEWRQLYTDLWQHTDTPYIARLIEAGKIPAPPGGAQSAPELAAAIPCEGLAADNATLRERLTEVLAWFADNGSGRYARVSGTVLARAYRDGGLTVPNELRKFL